MYKASIKEVFGRDGHELSAKERVQFKDTSDCVKLDEATQEGAVLINPVMWGVLLIHNDKSDTPEYDNYIIKDQDGTRYITGSASFWRAFNDIQEDMEEVDESWSIKVYRMPSKNYKGKDFLTCSVV